MIYLIHKIDFIIIINFIFGSLLLFIQISLRRIEAHFKNDYSNSIIKKIKNIKEKIPIDYRDFYAYNPISRALIIEKKGTYSICDYFKLEHEIAHSKHDRTRVIYFYMIIIAVYRILFIPVYIVLCIIGLLGGRICKEVYLLLIIILTLFILIKTYYILKYEIKASKDAFFILRKSIARQDASYIFKFAVCCIFQQLLVTFIIGSTLYFFMILSMRG